MAVVSLRSDEFTLDPYDTYAYMREQEPVLWDDETATWYVARFADVYGLLGSPALAARGVMSWVEDLEPREREIVEPVEEFFAAWPVFSNRPDHEVLRQALLTSLGRSALRTLEEPLERWTRQICSGFAPGDDIVTGFARPLGIRSLCEVLGVSTDEAQWLDTLSDQLITYLITSGSMVDAAARASEAIEKLDAWVRTTLLPRGRGLVPPALSQLWRSNKVPIETAVGTVAQFLIGAAETT